MNWLKTGDIVKAFRTIWPFITGEMIRAEADQGHFKAMQFGLRGGYYYDPESVIQYLEKRTEIDPDKRREALKLLVSQLHTKSSA